MRGRTMRAVQETMLYFTCPHCGNHLRLEDEFAGRDGWCRACKGMIVAPSPGGSAPGIETLSLDERYNRLYQLFRFAATKADNYKLLLGRLRHQRDALSQELNKAQKWRDGLAEAQRQCETLQRQVSARTDETSEAIATRRTAEAELAALRLECERLRNVAAEQAVLRATLLEPNPELSALQRRAAEREVELATAQETVAALEERLRVSEAAAEEASARARAAESRVASLTEVEGGLRKQVQALEGDREERDRTVRAHRETHEREVQALQADVARLRAHLDEAGISVSSQIRELEQALQDAHQEARRQADRAADLERELHAARSDRTATAAERDAACAEAHEREMALAAAHHERVALDDALTAARESEAALRADRDTDAKARAGLSARIEELESELRRVREESTETAQRLAEAEAAAQEAVARETLDLAPQELGQAPSAAEATAPEHPVEDVEDADSGDAEELTRILHERDELQRQLVELREDYAMLEQEYEALQEELDIPSFGPMPKDNGDLLSPMPPAPPDANATDEHVIIPEVVMEDPERPDPMVNALLRFMSKERSNDEDS